MKIITDAFDDIVFYGDEEVVAEGNTYKVPSKKLVFKGETYHLYEVDSVPDDIFKCRYKYLEPDGFIRPFVLEEYVDSKVKEAIDAYTLELIEGGVLA